MGRDVLYPPSDILKHSATNMVNKANKLLALFGQYRRVTSGYRPESINAKVPGAARHSNHIVCRAVDLEDADGKLDEYCVKNQRVLEDIGLWLESPSSTDGWTHVQLVPPLSGHRIFFA